jgi:hypothetical protein
MLLFELVDEIKRGQNWFVMTFVLRYDLRRIGKTVEQTANMAFIFGKSVALQYAKL